MAARRGRSRTAHRQRSRAVVACSVPRAPVGINAFAVSTRRPLRRAAARRQGGARCSGGRRCLYKRSTGRCADGMPLYMSTQNVCRNHDTPRPVSRHRQKPRTAVRTPARYRTVACTHQTVERDLSETRGCRGGAAQSQILRELRAL
jgi:hypothetical protein